MYRTLCRAARCIRKKERPTGDERRECTGLKCIETIRNHQPKCVPFRSSRISRMERAVCQTDLQTRPTSQQAVRWWTNKYEQLTPARSHWLAACDLVRLPTWGRLPGDGAPMTRVIFRPRVHGGKRHLQSETTKHFRSTPRTHRVASRCPPHLPSLAESL